MTDPTDSCCPPSDLDRAAAAFRRHAFVALLDDPAAPLVAEIAGAASRDAVDVEHAIAWLEAHGQLEREGEQLVSACGLTRRITLHSLEIDGRILHTWCAYDAVAIPVALGATASAATTCLTCQQRLVVHIDSGHLPAEAESVLWMPAGPCEHVIDDFCAHANLFCTPEHLDTWRRTAGDPPGRIVALAEVPALARVAWADVAPTVPTEGPSSPPQVGDDPRTSETEGERGRVVTEPVAADRRAPQTPPPGTRTWYLPVMALAVCPASKLVVLAVSATAIGGLAAGALAIAMAGVVAGGGLYFWTRRHRPCDRHKDTTHDRQTPRPGSITEP